MKKFQLKNLMVSLGGKGIAPTCGVCSAASPTQCQDMMYTDQPSCYTGVTHPTPGCYTKASPIVCNVCSNLPTCACTNFITPHTPNVCRVAHSICIDASHYPTVILCQVSGIADTPEQAEAIATRKAELTQQLADLEALQKHVESQLKPQSMEDIEELEKHLNEALDELKKQKAGFKKGGK